MSKFKMSDLRVLRYCPSFKVAYKNVGPMVRIKGSMYVKYLKDFRWKAAMLQKPP